MRYGLGDQLIGVRWYYNSKRMQKLLEFSGLNCWCWSKEIVVVGELDRGRWGSEKQAGREVGDIGF